MTEPDLADENQHLTSTGPVLSVIITCFNYEHFVGHAIDSVLEQRFPSVEIIVVDDGSTDGSWSHIQSYGSKIKAIATVRRGALGASLAGFAISTGRFIHFLDADDALCPGALDTLKPYFRQDVSKIQFMLTPIDERGQIIGLPFPRITDSDDSAALISAINMRGYYHTPPTSGNIYRRDVYEQLGDLGYERAIDGVPYLLAPFLGRVVSVGRPLGHYRIHESNLSAFASLSPSRIRGYADRFSGRLAHLDTILRDRRLDGRGFRIKPTYSYLIEMDLLQAVAAGRRVGLGQIRSYADALKREQNGLRRHLFLIFYCFLALLPRVLATRLMTFRMNQASGPLIRRQLKWIISRL